MLNQDEKRRIEAAIREAERGTAGEIVVVVTRQASRYRAVPILYSLVAALLTPWPLILFTELGPTRIGLVQLGLALAVLLLSGLPGLRFALVPPSLKRMRAREAAQREFASRGMTDTRGRTGVLLFVAEAEHHAEVIGDVAISGEVPEEAWRGVIEALATAFRARRYADGLVAAIAAVGAILARHAPPGAGDVDELPNRVVLL
ncbi:MAG: hypothetical protein JWR08_468 [Enterovirga sp.]|jgi:putative membrane protein|nr:hypothetical protein [Enterovirga sp.]